MDQVFKSNSLWNKNNDESSDIKYTQNNMMETQTTSQNNKITTNCKHGLKGNMDQEFGSTVTRKSANSLISYTLPKKETHEQKLWQFVS